MIKKIIYILILIITYANFALAEPQNGYLEYSGFPYQFKSGDEIKFLKNANKNMQLFEKSQTAVSKIFYLQESMRYYFMLSKANPQSIDAQIGLGRVYDEFKLDRFAKEHFFNAYNLNNHNPKMAYYFANFYYKRKDLLPALAYYNMAYKYGYSKSYYTNYRLGEIYEKLADIKSAKKFYSNAIKLNPKDAELRNKIRLLDELNYS